MGKQRTDFNQVGQEIGGTLHRVLGHVAASLLIDTEDNGSVRWGWMKAVTRTLSTNSGSLGNLNVLLRLRLQTERRPHSAVVWESHPAIKRIDLCIASAGVIRNVRSITAVTLPPGLNPV